MHEFRFAWRGQDLFDSVEYEGMVLTSRACYWMACELVFSIRGIVKNYGPEPWQDVGWASCEFSHLGQRIRCVVAMQDENEYSVNVSCVQGLLGTLVGRRPPEIRPESVALVRNALNSNPRFEVLASERTA
jgi:hypothetical protein